MFADAVNVGGNARPVGVCGVQASGVCGVRRGQGAQMLPVMFDS